MSKKVLEEATEWCPDCGYETTKLIDSSNTKSFSCVNCGRELFLCSICYEECGQCNPSNPHSYCHQAFLEGKEI